MTKLTHYSGKEYRTIGNKRYRYVHAYRLKRDAQGAAKLLRDKGKRVRVIPFINGYGVFVS